MSQNDAVVRPMTEADLGLVLSWRNHPSIRQYMYTQHEIRMDEHRRWFAQASVDPARRLLIFELATEALGYVSFQQLNAGPVVDWGFYIAPDAPKGTGRRLGTTALRHAFEREQFHKVCGQALECNSRSIQFHLSLGFAQEGCLREHFFDGTSFQSVTCFGLLAQEWRRATAVG